MNRFTTDIPQQTIRIDGEQYAAHQATSPTEGGESPLQVSFRRRYGEDSFHASLAGFLTEWFDGRPVLTVHTSGSTGTPKELQVEKRRMMNSAMMTVSFLGLHRGDSALLCMPLKYIAGKMVVVRALVAGLDLIPVSPCGNPLKQLRKAPDFAAMIPMQVFNSLQTPAERGRLTRIRHLIIGGGSIDQGLEKALQTFPHAVWSTYGMTETLSHIALRRLNGTDASCWYTPFGNLTLSLSAGQTLVIDAPLVSPVRLETNDIAEFNEKGQFRILGRRDNTINTGGVKVQTEQVEEALKTRLPYPFQITSAPDKKFGERIVLLLQADPNESAGRLKEAVESLPPYWRPKQTVYVGQLPLTETGKPDRAAARRMAEEI